MKALEWVALATDKFSSVYILKAKCVMACFTLLLLVIVQQVWWVHFDFCLLCQRQKHSSAGIVVKHGQPQVRHEHYKRVFKSGRFQEYFSKDSVVQ